MGKKEGAEDASLTSWRYVVPIYDDDCDDQKNDDDDDDDEEDDDDDEDNVVKGGEGRTTESIRTGLKDARVVKGLGDKVTMMKR